MTVRRCRSSPRRSTRRGPSRRPRSSRRSARAPTASPTSGRAPTSPTSAATTIGPRTSRRTAASTSTSCATSVRDRTAGSSNLFNGTFDLREEFTSLLGDRLRRAARGEGRPHPARHAGTSIRRAGLLHQRASPSSRTGACARRSTSPSTSSGRTRTLFFGLYKRTTSFFGIDMKALGPPRPRRPLLGPFREHGWCSGSLRGPVSDGSGFDRRLMREASKLLDEAGWKIDGGKRRNGKGDLLEVEILIFDPTFERVLGPYVEDLRPARARGLDPARGCRAVRAAHEVVRLRPDDAALRHVADAERRAQEFATSTDMARMDGSFNLAGVADPVIDALTAKVMQANSPNWLRQPAPSTCAARALLGAALVQGRAPRGVLEQVLVAGGGEAV